MALLLAHGARAHHTDYVRKEDIDSARSLAQLQETPLHLACSNGHSGVVWLLLEADAAVDAMDEARMRNGCHRLPENS